MATRFPSSCAVYVHPPLFTIAPPPWGKFEPSYSLHTSSNPLFVYASSEGPKRESPYIAWGVPGHSVRSQYA